MATHIDTGKTGEEMAAEWLQQQGFEILHRNWRYSYYEVDIIARRGTRLHFIEVKTRMAGAPGHPEDSVSKKKFRYLQFAADEYLQQHPGNPWIQYDILAITLHKNGSAAYFLLEDVFIK